MGGMAGGLAVVEVGLLSWHTLSRSLNISDDPVNVTHQPIPYVEVTSPSFERLLCSMSKPIPSSTGGRSGIELR